MPQPGPPVRRRWELGMVAGQLGQFGQDLEQFLLQPGVQDDIWRSGYGLGPHFARGRTEQGQQLGRATTEVLVWLPTWFALWLPGMAGLRNGLIRASLVLTPEWDAHRFSDAVGQVDQVALFLSLRVDDSHHARYALALGGAGRTPGPCALVRTAGRLQHTPDRAGAHTRQPGSAQRTLQRTERPGRRSVRASVRFTLRGGDDLCACTERVAGFAAAARGDAHRGQADLVEPGHQVGHSRSAA